MQQGRYKQPELIGRDLLEEDKKISAGETKLNIVEFLPSSCRQWVVVFSLSLTGPSIKSL